MRWTIWCLADELKAALATYTESGGTGRTALDQDEAATVYRFTAWQRFLWVELPFATLGLVWNSMMSVAGGWFFLMVSEAFVLGEKDFRLPGIGAYMSVALSRGDVRAMVFAVLAMTLLIVVLDQFLWRPVVAWAQKFRVEEGAAEEAPTSWFLDLLRRSCLVGAAREGILALHRIIVWSKNGVVARSDVSVKRASDRIEYAETAARYEYMNLVAGEPGVGLTPEEVRDICTSFNVQQDIF